MNKTPILSRAALLNMINSKAVPRAVDSRYKKRPDGSDALLIYYDNGSVSEFKGLNVA